LTHHFVEVLKRVEVRGAQGVKHIDEFGTKKRVFR